jgi:MFS family permease
MQVFEANVANEALCRISEPIAFTSIFPYIYYMVQTFGITDDEKKISIYAGMVTSAFAIAEFSASIFWGWLSDKIGRKPVLLTGLAGTGISMLVFGFAKSLPVALLARTLGGLLNGWVSKHTDGYALRMLTCHRNIGVILTTVGEVVTVESHQCESFHADVCITRLTRISARAFSIMPFVWCLGYVFSDRP